jgi:TetR/AcrR family transcriptional repressor of nem operon
MAHNPVSRSVGRPREFDEAEVLDAAMQVFWRKGYESTSMADLMAATGLHKGSLYQAFGDKRTLYLVVLRNYLQALSGRVRQELLGADTALEGLRNAMRQLMDTCTRADARNPGCLALNALVEKGPQDEEVRQILDMAYAMRKKMVRQTVLAGQQEGSIRTDQSAEAIAGVLDMVLMGLAASVKGPVSSEQAEAIIDDALNTFRPPEAG